VNGLAPDSVGAELVAAGAAVVAAVLLGLLWDTAGGWRRVLVRTAVSILCVAAVSATAGAWVNRQTEAYSTWSALVGGTDEPDPSADESPDPPSEPEPVPEPSPSGAAEPNGASQPSVPLIPGGSRVETLTVAGKASGLTLTAWVYLPGAYDRPDQQKTRFPVIEALHGFPGSPRTWLDRLEVQQRLDREITAGRMAPTVVVFPYQTPRALVDTECLDLTKGPKALTFLTIDVPAAVRSGFRVRADRNGWGLIGYSAGGYCATNLLLRHPGIYRAAVSLSGYADAGISVGDGSEKTFNNVLWRLKNVPMPPVDLYLACARDDAHSMRDAMKMAGLARAPLSVTTGTVPHGGHSAGAWKAMEAPAFDWLSARLARPESAGRRPGTTGRKSHARKPHGPRGIRRA
jgi:enterochelin esterase-like enzyme